MEPLNKIVAPFDHLGGGLMPGCCGAVDGYLPEIRKPPVDDDMTHPCKRGRVRNSRIYFCYKNHSEIVIN